MLNSNGEGRHPCLISDCRRKAVSFSPLKMVLTVGVLYMTFTLLRYVLSIPALLKFLSRKDAVLCQMLFLHLLRGSYGSYPFFY